MGARKVAVVGAGIAGLGAAWVLARDGYDVVVLERERHAGGRLTSEAVDGFRLDTGGSTLSSADRELLDWVDALGLRDELLPLRPVVAAQPHRGRIREIDPRSLIGIARIPGVKPRHGLRLLRLPRLLARFGERIDPDAPERAADFDDRSLADFGRLYFGASVLERWMTPFVGSASPCDERQASRVLFLQRYRRHAAARMGLPRAPLAELVAAAAAALAPRYGAQVTRIEGRAGGGVRLALRAGGRDRDLDVDAAVVATRAPDAARLAAPVLTSAELRALAGVRYAPALSLTVGLRRPFAPYPLRIQVPRAEGSALESALLEPGLPGGRVPDTRGLLVLRATSRWSEANADAPEARLEQALLEGFGRIAPGVADAALFTRLQRAPAAHPRFDVGRYREIAQLARVQRELRREGRRVYFAGDYLMDPSWNGALASGRRAARALQADLG